MTDVASFTTELSEPLLHLGEVGVSSILDPKERTQVKPRRASQRLLPFVPPEVASRADLSNASGRAAFSRSRRHSSVESRCEGPGSITGGRGEPLSWVGTERAGSVPNLRHRESDDSAAEHHTRHEQTPAYGFVICCASRFRGAPFT